MKKLALGLSVAFTLSALAACTPADAPEDTPYDDNGGFQQESGQEMQGFNANRREMWGGWNDNRQFGSYGDTSRRGLRQYHRYGEQGLYERYGNPLGPRDRTLGYDWTRENKGADSQEAGMAQRIESRCQTLQGVRDAEVVIHHDDIIIGVQPEQGQNIDKLEAQIKKAVQDQANGKEVHVITDRNHFNRLGEINRGIRDGQPIENFARDLGEMIQDVGRAVTEPFRR